MERLSDILFKLNTQKDELEHVTERLSQREKEIFQRCIGAQLTGDGSHAKIYANECAEVRKIYATVESVQLALEKVTLRLESIEQFGNILPHLAPIMEVVRETKGEIAGIVPNVAGELENVTSLLTDLCAETGQTTSGELEVSVANEEARKILEMSREVANQRVRQQFPELPFEESTQSTIATGISQSPSEELEQPLLDQVLSYVRSHEGRLSVSGCARALSRTPNDVMKAIDRLAEEGKLALERE